MKALVILLVLSVISCQAVEERRMSLLDRILGPKVLHSGSVSISRSESVGPSLSQLISESSGGSTSSGSSSGSRDVRGLKKAVIVNPLETPSLADALANIATVLGKEPAAAVANDQTSLDAEDGEEAEAAEAASDDVALMGDDDCDNPLPSEAGGCKKKKKKGGSRARGSGSESGSGSSTGGSASEASAGEIHKLESLIKFAMKVSKSIPENVRKLEALKAKEETATENKARNEAVKTLEEHRRLMAEMAEHIVKLRAKLNELISKRSQLEKSDERLRKELQQMNESGAPTAE